MKNLEVLQECLSDDGYQKALKTIECLNSKDVVVKVAIDSANGRRAALLIHKGFHCDFPMEDLVIRSPDDFVMIMKDMRKRPVNNVF